MQDEDWKDMREAAARLGADYVSLLEETGRQEIEDIQRVVFERFRAEGQVQMNAGEWLIALRRYRLITEGRDFSEMETEKALRLVFHQHWLYDRYGRLLETLSLTPAPDKESDPLGAITVRNTFHKRKIRLRGLKDEKIAEVEKGDKEAAFNAVNELAEYAQELTKIGEAFTTEVAEYSVASGIGKIDRMQMSSIHSAMDKLGKDIDAVENELGLKTDRSEETYQSKFKMTLDKAERFAKAHPREYTWWCPVCNWEGVLHRRRPPEGALINRLDIWWVWKCPQCGKIIAYDVEHPLFDNKMLFWRRAWDLVKRGVLSLKDAAYLHECAPEHLVVAVQQTYREKLPPHVEREWEEIEAQSRLQHKDDGQVQEDLPDGGEVEE